MNMMAGAGSAPFMPGYSHGGAQSSLAPSLQNKASPNLSQFGVDQKAQPGQSVPGLVSCIMGNGFTPGCILGV